MNHKRKEQWKRFPALLKISYVCFMAGMVALVLLVALLLAVDVMENEGLIEDGIWYRTAAEEIPAAEATEAADIVFKESPVKHKEIDLIPTGLRRLDLAEITGPVNDVVSRRMAELEAERRAAAAEKAKVRPAAERKKAAPSYEATDYVLRVLTAEVGSDEALAYCVTQCLFNACEKYGWEYTPAEMLVKYQYTGSASWISDAVRQAYDDIFLSGVTCTAVRDALYFYAPRYVSGTPWHESQRFIVEVNGVRFFGEVKK